MATLTHAMLDDLHIGNACLSILDYASSGVDITSGLDFSGADQLYTLEDTFNLSCDDPSSTDIRIDQHREVIDVAIDKSGNWTMTGNIPTQAVAVFNKFYTAGAEITAGTASSPKGVTGAEGTFYTGKGFMATPNIVEVTVLAESETKNTAILFPHVKLIVSKPKKDDNSNPLYLTFTGFILPNAYKSGNNYVGDFAVLKATTAPSA